MHEALLKPGEVLQQEPPMNWFVGLGYEDKGISCVVLNSKVTDTEGKETSKQFADWKNMLENFPSKKERRRYEHAQSAITTAESYLREVTGYTPQEISKKARLLQGLYRGKTAAPFPVELYQS